MKPWSQSTVAEYRGLPLRAHGYFADVPVYDIWRVDLPGLGRSCTMLDVRATMRAMSSEPPSVPVRSLFALRALLGRLFHWDASQADTRDDSWRARLAAQDVDSSLVPTGTRDGAFSILYVHDADAASEIRNR